MSEPAQPPARPIRYPCHICGRAIPAGSPCTCVTGETLEAEGDVIGSSGERGLEWSVRCPSCGTTVTGAQYGWGETKCACGRVWTVAISVRAEGRRTYDR
jgi:hypothetical protein